MEVLYRVSYPKTIKGWIGDNPGLDINVLLKKALTIISDNNSSDAWAVEFGAWDADHCHLSKVKKKFNLSAVLIESEDHRYEKLNNRYKDDLTVTTINGMVGWGEEDDIDYHLSQTRIPLNFELLIVDIDGNDYHVLSRLKNYQPKIVMVEFNPCIPNDIVYIQEKKPGINRGASLLALKIMMEEKGYRIIGTLGCNAIFVKHTFAHLFIDEDLSVEDIHDDEIYRMIFFQLYDGTIKSGGLNLLWWRGTEICEEDIQVLPRSIRRFLPPERRNPTCTYSIFNSYPSLKLTANDFEEENVLVWGAGDRFKKLIESYGNKLKNIDVVDSDPELKNKTIIDYQIHHPEELDFSSYDILIICSYHLVDILQRGANIPHFERLKIKYYDPSYPLA